MKNKKTLLACLLTSVAATATASEGRWYINPAVGIQDFDTERRLDDETTYTIGGEYRYNDNWATELRVLDSSPDGKNSKLNDTDVSQYYLDALYYFKPMTAKWQPFALLGLGHAEFDSKFSDSKETQANAGVGVRYSLNDNWSLRGDLRGLYGFDDGTWDSLVNLGISYAFGSSSKPAPVDGDSDNDGVADSRDSCPNTPAGAAVDVNGCALDSDGDGVADYKDQCPNTPQGRKVDDKGCKLPLVRDISMAISVNFASNSATVIRGEIQDVNRLVKFMKTYPEVPVEISGFTDNTGSAAYNKKLSQRRADAVRAILINKHGLDAKRLTAIGYGEEQPVADNGTAAGRLANRRVVATVKHQVEE